MTLAPILRGYDYYYHYYSFQLICNVKLTFKTYVINCLMCLRLFNQLEIDIETDIITVQPIIDVMKR